MNLHHFSPQNAKIFARISPTQNHQILFHDCFHLITYLLLHSLALEWLNKLKKESRLRSPKLLKSLSPPLSTKTSPSASSPMDTDLREEEFWSVIFSSLVCHRLTHTPSFLILSCSCSYCSYLEDKGLSFVGKNVTVGGWSRTQRLQGGGSFAFISLNDGSCFDSIQVIGMSFPHSLIT